MYIRGFFTIMNRNPITIVVLLTLVPLSGCANRASDEEPMSMEQQVAYGAGYYEVEHEGTRYVVGSAEAAKAVPEGKVPQQTVYRFSGGGKRVLIDATDPATRYRLEHEYDRRHGTAVKF